MSFQNLLFPRWGIPLTEISDVKIFYLVNRTTRIRYYLRMLVERSCGSAILAICKSLYGAIDLVCSRIPDQPRLVFPKKPCGNLYVTGYSVASTELKKKAPI